MTYTRTHRRRQWLASILLLIATVVGAVGAAPQPARADPGAPPLAEERIYVVGLELRPGPAHQVAPKNQGTSVAATLAVPNTSEPGASAPGAPGLPSLPADAVVLGELSGPAFGEPVTLAATPGGNFAIPPLAIPGLYTLGNIRLVNNGQVVLVGNPAVVRIEVIDRVLVSQVTSRPLSADEIKERGIVIDERNFQVVNFTVGFGLQDQQVNIDLPMLFPSGNTGGLPGVPIYPMPSVGASHRPGRRLAAHSGCPAQRAQSHRGRLQPGDRRAGGAQDPRPGRADPRRGDHPRQRRLSQPVLQRHPQGLQRCAQLCQPGSARPQGDHRAAARPGQRGRFARRPAAHGRGGRAARSRRTRSSRSSIPAPTASSRPRTTSTRWRRSRAATPSTWWRARARACTPSTWRSPACSTVCPTAPSS
jgi:hypothetical protein